MGLTIEDYETLAPGHRWESGKRIITAEDIACFAALTGDIHPQYLDPVYAAASPYGTQIAHGYLTISLAAGLSYQLGLDEGTSIAILGLSWSLPAPVLIGDTIHVVVTLESVRRSNSYPDKGIVKRRSKVFNQHGDVIATGDVTLLCRLK